MEIKYAKHKVSLKTPHVDEEVIKIQDITKVDIVKETNFSVEFVMIVKDSSVSYNGDSDIVSIDTLHRIKEDVEALYPPEEKLDDSVLIRGAEDDFDKLSKSDDDEYCPIMDERINSMVATSKMSW